MSSNRRKFLQTSALASLSVVVPINIKANETEKLKKTKKENKPIVLATWDFGLQANAEAWKVLETGGRALDAVEAGVKLVENDPTERSVGYGGRPDRDGRVTLDACIMDDNFNIGSVAFLEHIKNPISVARLVMEKTPHVMLVGEGALAFALSQGFKKENLLTNDSEKEWKEWLKTSNYLPPVNIENHDTIGMIALDADGNLSGACTTSGLAYKMNGRVGDSPIIGAGLYVDNEVGAVTATGHGEEVIRTTGAHLVVEFMRQGKSPQQACQEAIQRIVAIANRREKNLKNIQVGFLAINKNGEHGAYSVQDGFSYAKHDKTGNKLIKSDFSFQ